MEGFVIGIIATLAVVVGLSSDRARRSTCRFCGRPGESYCCDRCAGDDE